MCVLSPPLSHLPPTVLFVCLFLLLLWGRVCSMWLPSNRANQQLLPERERIYLTESREAVHGGGSPRQQLEKGGQSTDDAKPPWHNMEEHYVFLPLWRRLCFYALDMNSYLKTTWLLIEIKVLHLWLFQFCLFLDKLWMLWMDFRFWFALQELEPVWGQFKFTLNDNSICGSLFFLSFVLVIQTSCGWK